MKNMGKQITTAAIAAAVMLAVLACSNPAGNGYNVSTGSNAGMASLTISGMVYKLEAEIFEDGMEGSLGDRFRPDTVITGITALGLETTGSINTEGFFSFTLPNTVNSDQLFVIADGLAFLEDVLADAPDEVLGILDGFNFEISNPNAGIFPVAFFEVPEYGVLLMGNITNLAISGEEVDLNLGITVFMYVEEAFHLDGGGVFVFEEDSPPITVPEFRVNFSRGWNRLHINIEASQMENAIRFTFHGGEPNGQRWGLLTGDFFNGNEPPVE